MYSVEKKKELKKCFSDAIKAAEGANAASVTEAVKGCYAKLDLVFTPCVQECINEYVVENYKPSEQEILNHAIGEINVGLCYYNCETY